jgi:hypothetical protein
MKPFVAAVCFAILVSLVAAQDRLAQDEARRYAKVCVKQLGSLDDAQIEMDVDVEKPCAVRGEGGGAMAIPDKKLTKEKLAKAGKDVVPVGQVWLRKWTVVVAGKPVPNDKLRVVTIKVDDKDRPMPLLFVGVRKKEKIHLELVVYAKDSKPLLTLPLKRVDFIQDLPVEMEWQRGEKDTDSLTLTVLGKYQSVLPVTRQ